MRLRHLMGLAIVVVAIAALAAQLGKGLDPMTLLAERYVKLVLALGEHDADYVDAYYGPEDWKRQATVEKRSLAEIDADAYALRNAITQQRLPDTADELTRLRRTYLIRQVEALGARVASLMGTRLDFDEESKALYDAVDLAHTESEFGAVIADLNRRLPGSGSVQERYDAFRNRFVIPTDRLDAVFTAAIEGCRERTRQHITLPADEQFTVEYVSGKSWSGYNWYQGHYRSVIQVNTDLPIYVDRALDLACHEGYPGHHVYNVLLEKTLVRDRGWPEFMVHALFSPQSLIAEGTATYGVEIAFPGQDRVDFERRVIFPKAGLDPAAADEYYEVQAIVDRLSYARNEAARRYLNGVFDAPAAAMWLEQYALMSPAGTAQRLKFFDQYRSYVINYNLGKDMVARHIALDSGSPDPAARWKAFERLLASPRLPSGLRRPSDGIPDALRGIEGHAQGGVEGLVPSGVEGR
jgi:hypothetical protein